MADLEVKFHDDRCDIISQVFCCTIHDTWENRKVWFVILRSLCAPNTGKPFFSYQRIADEFGYQADMRCDVTAPSQDRSPAGLFLYASCPVLRSRDALCSRP